MRCILVILDGLGDRGQECFGGKTPLYAAFTPNLDHLASMGMNGLYHTSMQGVPMSSESAHFIIFGYELRDFPGRGYIEARGRGVPVADNDVAVLCHLCSVEQRGDNLILSWGRPDISPDDVRALEKEIETFESGGIGIRLISSRGIDGFLVLRGDVAETITDSDPIYEGRAVMQVLPYGEEIGSLSGRTARAMNEYIISCYRRLSGHAINRERVSRGLPAVNCLVTQRAGKRRQLESFRDKWGLRGLSISSGAIYWGLCEELGMDVTKVKDSGNIEEDFIHRLQLARDAVDYDFIHVHTKMPDEAGHTKNPWYKKDVIESIDRAMSFAVREICQDKDVLLIVTADHSTASSGGMIHTGETVPITMVGKYVRRDEVGYFNEIACANGSLGLLKGTELMHMALNFMDRAKMRGLMDTPADQPYYPGKCRSLIV